MKQASSKKTSSAHLYKRVDDCIAHEPQIIRRNSLSIAVLVLFEHWQLLWRAQQPSLKELLITEDHRVNMVIPKRGRCRTRRHINFI